MSGKSRRIRNWTYSIQAIVSPLFLFFFSVFLLFSVCFIPIREGNDDFSATWKLDWVQEKILLTGWLWGYYSRPLFPCPGLLTSCPCYCLSAGDFPHQARHPFLRGGSRLLCSRFLLISVLPSLFQGLWQCGRVPQPTIPRHSMCSMAGWEEAHPPLRGW